MAPSRVMPWLILVLVAVAWDVLGIDTGPHQYHLTISALAQAYRPLNAALVLFWILAGVGYEMARVVPQPAERPSRRATRTRRRTHGPSYLRRSGCTPSA